MRSNVISVSTDKQSNSKKTRKNNVANILQELAQVRLKETAQELTSSLSSAADAVLGLSEAELAEAGEAYSSMARDSSSAVKPAEEDEDLFACRAALLRLHHLQLLTQMPAENSQLYTSLHKLLEVVTSIFAVAFAFSSLWFCGSVSLSTCLFQRALSCACTAALLRLHHLQLLTQMPSENSQLYTSLHKLLEVSGSNFGCWFGLLPFHPCVFLLLC